MKVYAQKQSRPQQRASGIISRSSAQQFAATHRLHPILNLQRTIGNQAVQRLLQANAGAPEAGPRVQRTPDKDPKKAPDKDPKKAPDKEVKRIDVVLLGEGVKGGKELARVLAPGGKIISVKSMSDAVDALSKIDVPIRTLYFITHSLQNGALEFGTGEGFVKPDDIAKKVTGSVPTDKAPQNVDFRGCSVGTSPKAMDQIRGAFGATSVQAGNCYAVIRYTTPVKIGGQEITKESDVAEEHRTLFEDLRAKTVAHHMGPAKKCILNNSDKGYFALGGKYLALWFNTSLSDEWKKDESVCYKDLKPETVDPNKALADTKGCHLIRVEAKPNP